MRVQVDIGFDELLKVVETLPAEQLMQLKAKIDIKAIQETTKGNLEALLLNGPVATKEQIETIEGNRNAIIQWRTK